MEGVRGGGGGRQLASGCCIYFVFFASSSVSCLKELLLPTNYCQQGPPQKTICSSACIRYIQKEARAHREWQRVGGGTLLEKFWQISLYVTEDAYC